MQNRQHTTVIELIITTTLHSFPESISVGISMNIQSQQLDYVCLIFCSHKNKLIYIQ